MKKNNPVRLPSKERSTRKAHQSDTKRKPSLNAMSVSSVFLSTVKQTEDPDTLGN